MCSKKLVRSVTPVLGSAGVEDRDRELLEKYAPCLRYDAQDGYRAVAAETMTAPACNSLTRERGAVIAGQGSFASLSIDTLIAYPGRIEFEEGDRLIAAPSPLQSAVKMQAESDRFPHCAYGRVVPRGRRGDLFLQYWLWYYDNPKTFLGRGRHQGDWEMVVVRLRADGEPHGVLCSQHEVGEARRWDKVDKHDGTHPIVYVAPFSHANYFEPGTHFYFPAADHPTDRGPDGQIPKVVEFGPWQEWRGRWGSSDGILMGTKLLRPLVRGRLGGRSPTAPIAQEGRWLRPDSYYHKALRRKPISAFKKALWFLGKATFPADPKIAGVRPEGSTVTVAYELGRRSRHLLLTIHNADEDEDMLLSQVIRKAPRRGEETMHIPGPPNFKPGNPVVVYASAFGPAGQRSNPIRHPEQPG